MVSEQQNLSAELTRFRGLRQRFVAAGGAVDDAAAVEAIEGVISLRGAIVDAVRSALEDERVACRYRGRIDEMEARLRRIERRAEGRREEALQAMAEAGLACLEAPGLRIDVRRAPEVVIVSDESLIPDAYRVERPALLDYQAIRDTLKEGAEVPGAALAEPEPYLSVRTS